MSDEFDVIFPPGLKKLCQVPSIVPSPFIFESMNQSSSYPSFFSFISMKKLDLHGFTLHFSRLSELLALASDPLASQRAARHRRGGHGPIGAAQRGDAAGGGGGVPRSSRRCLGSLGSNDWDRTHQAG